MVYPAQFINGFLLGRDTSDQEGSPGISLGLGLLY